MASLDAGRRRPAADRAVLPCSSTANAGGSRSAMLFTSGLAPGLDATICTVLVRQGTDGTGRCVWIRRRQQRSAYPATASAAIKSASRVSSPITDWKVRTISVRDADRRRSDQVNKGFVDIGHPISASLVHAHLFQRTVTRLTGCPWRQQFHPEDVRCLTCTSVAPI